MKTLFAALFLAFAASVLIAGPVEIPSVSGAAATNALNTRMGLVESATNALSSKVASLQIASNALTVAVAAIQAKDSAAGASVTNTVFNGTNTLTIIVIDGRIKSLQ